MPSSTPGTPETPVTPNSSEMASARFSASAFLVSPARNINPNLEQTISRIKDYLITPSSTSMDNFSLNVEILQELTKDSGDFFQTIREHGTLSSKAGDISQILNTLFKYGFKKCWTINNDIQLALIRAFTVYTSLNATINSAINARTKIVERYLNKLNEIIEHQNEVDQLSYELKAARDLLFLLKMSSKNKLGDVVKGFVESLQNVFYRWDINSVFYRSRDAFSNAKIKKNSKFIFELTLLRLNSEYVVEEKNIEHLKEFLLILSKKRKEIFSESNMHNRFIVAHMLYRMVDMIDKKTEESDEQIFQQMRELLLTDGVFCLRDFVDYERAKTIGSHNCSAKTFISIQEPIWETISKANEGLGKLYMDAVKARANQFWHIIPKIFIWFSILQVSCPIVLLCLSWSLSFLFPCIGFLYHSLVSFYFNPTVFICLFICFVATIVLYLASKCYLSMIKLHAAKARSKEKAEVNTDSRDKIPVKVDTEQDDDLSLQDSFDADMAAAAADTLNSPTTPAFLL